jgi:hypothetical protein
MLKEYIRNILLEDYCDNTILFQEHSREYDSRDIMGECLELCSECRASIDNLNLSYFAQEMGEVVGCAWTGTRNHKFNFFVMTSEDASDLIYEDLVRDCIDEFEILKNKDSGLKLEVHVDDDETESYLKENFNMKVLRAYPGVAIMGLKA